MTLGGVWGEFGVSLGDVWGVFGMSLGVFLKVFGGCRRVKKNTFPDF